MDQKPDYVGSWGSVLFAELPRRYDPRLIETGGAFYLFIESRSEASGNTRFTGRTEDCYGNARVEGTLKEKGIIFTKQYDESAKRKGGRKAKMTYQGVRTAVRLRPEGLGEEEFFAGIVTSRKMKLPRVFIMKSLR